nr:unnamed protein product [Callosobruchus analis]
MAESVTNSDLLKAIQDVGESLKNELTTKIVQENQKVLQKIDKCSQRIDKLEKRCQNIENKCTNLDRLLRKNNIILTGISPPKKRDELLPFVLELLNTKLDLKYSEHDINNVSKFKINEKWIVKVEFSTFINKGKAMKNVKKLKGSGIYIDDDLNQHDRQIRKQLYQHLKEARAKNMFAKIRGNKLQINDDFYTLEELEVTDAAEKSDDGEGEPKLTQFHQPESRSAPHSPESYTHLTFFEDSLNAFALKTPQTETQNQQSRVESRSESTSSQQEQSSDRRKINEEEKNIKCGGSQYPARNGAEPKLVSTASTSTEKEVVKIASTVVRSRSTSSDKGTTRVTRQKNK